jgi:hypothetical protein
MTASAATFPTVTLASGAEALLDSVACGDFADVRSDPLRLIALH